MAQLLIVGGGLSGSLLALYLARRGHDVDVFERHADPCGEHGGARSALNITLCERGLAALGGVDMREATLKLTVPARGRRVHARDGSIAYQPYGNRGEAIYSISRSDLNRALIDRAGQDARVHFHFEQKLVQVNLEDGVARFQHTSSGEVREVKATRIFGADGAYSRVRTQMQRGQDFNYSQQYWRHGGYKSLWLPAPANGTPALEGEAIHIWPRGSRMLIGFPNRDGSAMLSLLLPFAGENSYEQLTGETRLLNFFRSHFPDVAGSIPALAEQFFAKPANSLVTVRCDPWSRLDRALLIGDAAHAILPSYGQGANAGFEDCAILDRCLDERNEDWGAAFREFEQQRRPALDVMSQLCIEHFAELTDLVGDPAFLRRRETERSLSDLYPELYQPLYSMVSFTRLPYDEAFRIAQRQHDAIDRIVALENVDSKLESPEVRRILQASMEGYPVGTSLNKTQATTSAQQPENSIFALGMSFWGAKAVLSAVELGVFSALSKGPRTLGDLCEALGLHPRSAADFLDALTALGLLSRADGNYAATAGARDALLPDGASYIGGALELANARLYPVWGKLSAALRSGQPQNEAQQTKDYYGNLTQDPERLRTFLRGMSGLSRMAAKALVRKFHWQDYACFVDVGGAEGVLPVQLATMHSHLTGINFDLPPVQSVFEEYVRATGLEARLAFQSGDFFVDALPTADVIVMGHVLHNWSLDQKRILIRKAYEALPSGGALIVYEALIDDGRCQNAFGLLMSLNMLLVTAEGFVFSGHDCEGWMRDAGFSSSYVRHLHGPDSMVVGIK